MESQEICDPEQIGEQGSNLHARKKKITCVSTSTQSAHGVGLPSIKLTLAQRGNNEMIFDDSDKQFDIFQTKQVIP